MDIRKSRLTNNMAILSIGVFCTKGIMFFMTPLFTSWLSSEQYGLFDLLINYAALLLPIFTISTGESLFRFLLDDDKNKGELLVTGTVIYLCGIVLAFTTIICITFLTDLSTNVSIALGIYLCTDMINNLCVASTRGLKKLNYYSYANIVFVLAMSLGVFLLVKIAGLGLAGILLGYAVGNLSSSIVLILGTKVWKEINSIYFSFKSAKELIKYSLPMIPNAISWWIISVFDRGLITAILGANENGVYAVSNKIPSLCQTILGVFHLSWQQSATESLNDEDRDIYYSTIFNDLILALISICILLFSFNYWYFYLLFSSEYFHGYYQAPILIFSLFFMIPSQFLGGIYVAQKRSVRNGQTTIIGALTDIIINLCLIKKIGLYAASISTLVAYMVLFAVRWVDISKNCRIKIYKRTKKFLIAFLYFFLIQYSNSYLISIINIPVAVVLFVYINRRFIESIIRKMSIIR